jgi:hypothetical protein
MKFDTSDNVCQDLKIQHVNTVMSLQVLVIMLLTFIILQEFSSVLCKLPFDHSLRPIEVHLLNCVYFLLNCCCIMHLFICNPSHSS